jgi:glycosyltransferase involved in cell wall biosynthesis
MDVSVVQPVSPRSILHVVAPAPAGGLERVVRALATGQSARGYTVTVAAVLERNMRRGADAAAEAYEHPFVTGFVGTGVLVVPVVVGRRSYLRERSAIRGLAEQHSAGIVHTHGRRPDIVDSGIARALDVPAVTTVHGFTGEGLRSFVNAAIQRRAFRRFDGLVAVSDTVAEALMRFGVPPARVHVIQNAYDQVAPPLPRAEARARLGAGSDEFVIGWVGRLSPEKGLDVLLAALAELRDRPLTVAVIGSGGERAALESDAERRGVSGAVRWMGQVNDAPRLYSGFDLFVLSSRSEGTPIALFEAMDAEIPVVATAVGGVPAVVSSDEARLVAPGDPHALALAIRDAFDDPAPGHVRAASGLQRLRSLYAIDPWLDRYDRLYTELIVARPDRGSSRRSSRGAGRGGA